MGTGFFWIVRAWCIHRNCFRRRTYQYAFGCGAMALTWFASALVGGPFALTEFLFRCNFGRRHDALVRPIRSARCFHRGQVSRWFPYTFLGLLPRNDATQLPMDLPEQRDDI